MNSFSKKSPFVFISFLFFAFSCKSDLPTEMSAEEKNYITYCGNCHLPADPKDLTKDVWANSVLPEMGLRMGIPNKKADRREKLAPDELAIFNRLNIYPSEPIIEEKDWLALKEYILNRAPEKIPVDSTRATRSKTSPQFRRQDLYVEQDYGASMTSIEFDNQKKELWMGNFKNQIFHWTKKGNRSFEVESPVVDFHFTDEGTVFTHIGKLFPGNLPKGNLSLLGQTQKTILLDKLRRPVHSEYVDLNTDGKKEIVVAEFGHDIGGLVLFVKKKGQYERKPLLELPGAIKFYIEDINGDGLKDIIAMFAQGDESIWQFIQKENLTFEPKRLLRFPPHYGSSDFVFIDFDKDGRKDIISAHGDNADYSYIPKLYHGIRIHLNRNGIYEESFFYPIYGSTKVVAADFDEDGDIDLAGTAFFPEYTKGLKESFIYLENKNTKTFEFESQVVPSEKPIRSLCLEKADFDGDGDLDLVLGLFGVTPPPVPNNIKKQWDEAKYDISVMLNQLK